MWDVGGQDDLRDFWRHHFTGSQGLIYVVDSSDRDRLEEASKQFETVVTDLQLVDAAILILANKQDLPNAVTSDEIADIFEVERLCKDRKFYVQATTATTNEGVSEGMDWLAKNMDRL
jgi:GTPase SAR1 family protein